MEATTAYRPGLEGVIAGISGISHVDPDRDSLLYRGYDIRELAQQCCYEEVAYLLLYGDLPTKAELTQFQQKLTSQRTLPPLVLSTLSQLPKGTNFMDGLRSAVSLLAHFDKQSQDLSHDANVEKAIRLLAQIPTIIAAQWRYSEGQEPIAPDASLSHWENFMTMLTGKKTDPLFTKVFDTTMILYAEHGFNASTFSGRVTTSTLSDLHSGITAAIGTLKGSLHGGANEAAMEMLLEVGDESKAEAWINDALANKKKIMGFGHRVYKKGDTRAPILKALGQKLSEQVGNMKWHNMADIMETVMVREKGLYPNVDFPASYVYYVMGLPIPLYTPFFVASRVAGWSAHIIEQLDNNRLIRPKSEYNGPKYRAVQNIDQR